MNTTKRSVLLILVLALFLSGCAFGGKKTIGKDAALQIAMTDAGVTRAQITDVDVELERAAGSGWYEVDFESGRTDWEYRIDAYSGEILSAGTD